MLEEKWAADERVQEISGVKPPCRAFPGANAPVGGRDANLKPTSSDERKKFNNARGQRRGSPRGTSLETRNIATEGVSGE
jgi:hypothetical protein